MTIHNKLTDAVGWLVARMALVGELPGVRGVAIAHDKDDPFTFRVIDMDGFEYGFIAKRIVKKRK